MSDTTHQDTAPRSEDQVGGDIRRTRTPELEPWRIAMRAKVANKTGISPADQKNMVETTLDRWEDPEVPDDVVEAEQRAAVALLIRSQVSTILPKLKKNGASSRQGELFLPLLNEVYSLDGTRMRMFEFTKEQAQRWIYAELDRQEGFTRAKRRAVERVVEAAPYADRLIGDQLEEIMEILNSSPDGSEDQPDT